MFLITRPAGKADYLLAALDSQGIEYQYQPLITTQTTTLKPKDLQILQQADLLIFVSLSAVNAAAQQQPDMRLPATLCAVGQTTGRALQSWQGREVFIPQDQRSEGLLQLSPLQHVTGKQVVIVRGNGGRELIKQTLQQRGATVRYVQSYNRVPLSLDGIQLCKHWQNTAVRCIVVTSNEILHHIFSLVPTAEHHWLRQLYWILVSPRARESALALGVSPQNIALASNANDEALLEAVKQFKRNKL